MTGRSKPRKEESGNPDPVNNAERKNNYTQKFECPFCGAMVGKLPAHLPGCGETP